MKTEYQLQFHAELVDDGVFGHVLRWILLIVLTGGIAIIFYPFYFVRFVVDRITIVKVTEEDREVEAAELQSRAKTMALEASARGERIGHKNDGNWLELTVDYPTVHWEVFTDADVRVAGGVSDSMGEAKEAAAPYLPPKTGKHGENPAFSTDS